MSNHYFCTSGMYDRETTDLFFIFQFTSPRACVTTSTPDKDLLSIRGLLPITKRSVILLVRTHAFHQTKRLRRHMSAIHVETEIENNIISKKASLV